MNISEILIITSIISGLVSIPFLVLGPFSDYKPTGNVLLGLDDASLEQIPAKFSKVLTSVKFEKIYETAFGKFWFSMSSNRVEQKLLRPDRSVDVVETPEETSWVLKTNDYVLTVIRNPGKTTEEFKSSDGTLMRIKENGGVTENFEGFNPELLAANLVEAKDILQNEVQRMEQIKQETVLPDLGLSNYTVSSVSGVVINEFLPDPEGTDNVNEWIELYNKGTSDVDLSGWKIDDIENGGSSPYLITNGTIPAKGYKLFHINETKISLGNSGDMVRLIDKTDKVADSFSYSSSSSGVSIGRSPDGADIWVSFTTPTPGASNG